MHKKKKLPSKYHLLCNFLAPDMVANIINSDMKRLWYDSMYFV